MTDVAIVHYNTPELTSAAIRSLFKQCGRDWRVTVFDNSDRRPFRRRMKNVTTIDNTKGQVIDFAALLDRFPSRERSIGCARGCDFGSVRHMASVQKLWDILPDGFVLMESDILIRADISPLILKDYACAGFVQQSQPGNLYGIGRLMPMLCWINVPLCRAAGARYFDPMRSYGLLGGFRTKGNWYDTGAAFLEDVRRLKPALKGRHIDIRGMIEHYKSGSWKGNDREAHKAWLEEHKELWK